MWVPLVDGPEKKRFEALGEQGEERIRITELRGHFEPVPVAERAEYFPVHHVVSDQDDNTPVGFDLGSIPKLAETLSRARGRVAASERIAYPHPDGGVEYGFMAASPLFDGGSIVQDGGNGRGALAGFVVGFFRLGNLANAAISLLEPRGVDILILDESASPEERFLHFYASRLSPRVIGEENYEIWRTDRSEAKVAERIRVADRNLVIVCGRTALFRSAEAFQDGPWMALIVDAVARTRSGPVLAVKSFRKSVMKQVSASAVTKSAAYGLAPEDDSRP